MPPVLLLLFFLLQIKPALLLRLAPFPAAAFVFGFHLFPLGCKRLLGFGTDSGLSQEFGLHLRAIDFAGGGKFKAAPHNSAARLATSFPSSAACKFLDLPPVNLRNLHLHLTKNPFAGRPPHLRGVALNPPIPSHRKKTQILPEKHQEQLCVSASGFSICPIHSIAQFRAEIRNVFCIPGRTGEKSVVSI